MAKTELKKRWLTTKEAAAYLDCHPGTLAEDRLSGRRGIPFSRLGRVARYDVTELDKYLEARRTVPVKKQRKRQGGTGGSSRERTTSVPAPKNEEKEATHETV